MKQAIVIIPTYNERDNIERAIKAVLAQATRCKPWNLGVLVVDDTSPDKTYELVKSLSKSEPCLHLLINKQKSGLGGAYLKGMAHAFGELGADVVFEFDADLSHDPTKLPQFLEAIDKGADMVLGTRYRLGGSVAKEWGWHRKVLSRGANLLIMTILINFRYRDWTSGYRAIKKQVYESVSPLMSDERFSGYAFQIGFLYYALKQGFRVDESVPYQFVDRTVGESKVGPEYIKNTLEFILKMRMKELAESRVVKFALVGGIGALVQLVSLRIFRLLLSSDQLFTLAFFLSIEAAVFSNFMLNNVWTFADKKLKPIQMPLKFLAFNLSSFGSIAIQMIIATLGATFVGLFDLFTIPVLGVIDTGLMFAVVGIGLGMVWNFFAYTKFIWRTKAHE